MSWWCKHCVSGAEATYSPQLFALSTVWSSGTCSNNCSFNISAIITVKELAHLFVTYKLLNSHLPLFTKATQAIQLVFLTCFIRMCCLMLKTCCCSPLVLTCFHYALWETMYCTFEFTRHSDNNTKWCSHCVMQFWTQPLCFFVSKADSKSDLFFLLFFSKQIVLLGLLKLLTGWRKAFQT